MAVQFLQTFMIIFVAAVLFSCMAVIRKSPSEAMFSKIAGLSACGFVISAICVVWS